MSAPLPPPPPPPPPDLTFAVRIFIVRSLQFLKRIQQSTSSISVSISMAWCKIDIPLAKAIEFCLICHIINPSIWYFQGGSALRLFHRETESYMMAEGLFHDRITEDGKGAIPDSRVHGANMGPIWGRQDPDWPHVGPMNFAIWDRPGFNIDIVFPGIAIPIKMIDIDIGSAWFNVNTKSRK